MEKKNKIIIAGVALAGITAVGLYLYFTRERIERLLISQPEYTSTGVTIGSSSHRVGGESFTLESNACLTRVVYQMAAFIDPFEDGMVICDLYSSSNPVNSPDTFIASSVPVPASILTSSWNDISFLFEPCVSLVKNKVYIPIVRIADEYPEGNGAALRVCQPCGYSGQYWSKADGEEWWSNSNYDAYFYVYGY